MAKNEPSAEVAVRRNDNPLAFLETAKPLPELMVGRIDGTSWARALVLGEKYQEPNPDFLAKRMLSLKLNATSLFSAFEDNAMEKLQEWVTDTPDAGTGPIEVYDLYVAPSTLSEGNSTFIIFDCLNLTTGEQVTVSTGATAVQGFFLKALALGIWPVRCNIKRLARKDKGGRFMLDVFPPDA